MKSKHQALHPATLYALLTVTVVLASWMGDVYGLSVELPSGGEPLPVQSLISAEGLRWWLRHVVSNVTGFAPLGMVLIALLGVGLAVHSGFLAATLRRWSGGRRGVRRAVVGVVVVGLLSNVVGDAGYVLLLPLAAWWFRAVGLHPVAGLVAGFVSVACGYSANLFLSTADPLLARTTQEAVLAAGVSAAPVGALSNLFFMAASVGVLAVVLSGCVIRLASRMAPFESSVPAELEKPLSRRERRAWVAAAAVGLFFIAVVAVATFSPWGVLRGVTGGMMRSPFISGALFLMSAALGLMSIVYAFTLGRYRSERDVVAGLSHALALLPTYVSIVFFAAQFFACLSYSRLDQWVVIGLSGLVPAAADGVGGLLCVVGVSALLNCFCVSSTAKWALLAPVFVPALSAGGLSPDWVQCAYRIGDSATNALTPFSVYLPFALTLLLAYRPDAGYWCWLRLTFRCTLAAGLAWTALLVAWHWVGLPLGL